MVYNNIKEKYCIQNILFCKSQMLSNKTIINTTNASELSSITTLTMPSSSTNHEIVIWNGTSGNSIAEGHGVIITDGDLANVNSVTFDSVAANLSGANTIWISLANGHLMHGSTNLENFASGPALSMDNAFVHWDGTTGTVIQNFTVLVSNTNSFTVLGQMLLYADPAQNTFIMSRTVLGTMSGFNNTFVGINARTSMTSTARSNNTGFGYAQESGGQQTLLSEVLWDQHMSAQNLLTSVLDMQE
jgi:hypothetical protein